MIYMRRMENANSGVEKYAEARAKLLPLENAYSALQRAWSGGAIDLPATFDRGGSEYWHASLVALVEQDAIAGNQLAARAGLEVCPAVIRRYALYGSFILIQSGNIDSVQVAERTAPDVEQEFAQIRSQLDRIERAVTTSPLNRHGTAELPDHGTSPWSYPGDGSIATTSPGMPARDFPVMQVKNNAFCTMAGLGADFGNHLLQLERSEPLAATPPASLFVLQHHKVMAALQSFSEIIHPWYPILEKDFSLCISSCLANSFKRGTDSFLVLMILASGAIAQEATHWEALKSRPDAMYLNAALEMMHLVVLEQSLQSAQCLAATSIHYCLLLKPIQAHDLAVMAIKKLQDMHISGALQGDQSNLEHWIRVYRAVLLIDGELAIPLRLSDTHAWQHEEEIPLPTGTDIWSFANNITIHHPATPGDISSTQSDRLVTYLLAEVAMRRMLQRNTTSVSCSVDGTVEYAPVIARELEAQLEQWYSYLPESLRFSRYFEDLQSLASPQTIFLCTQYWACMVSISWPSIVKVMESQRLSQSTTNECGNYFHSFRQFIKFATEALNTCLPNKWTIYASIFAISVGAYLGASNPLLAPLASEETWIVLKMARAAFGDECRCHPSLSVMRESIRETLSSLPET